MRKLFTRLSSVLVLLFLSVTLTFAAAAGPLLKTTGGLSPTDGGTTTSTTPTFTMTFQEDVFPGVGGTFGVYKASGAALKVVQITGAVTDNANGTVTFSGKTVTVAFKGVTFTEKASYYVKVEGLAIKNAAGDIFDTSALSGSTTAFWDFTIGDFTAPAVATVTGGAYNLTPRDNATGVSTSTVTSTVVFTENVQWSATHAAGAATGLKLGDIALYEDTGFGEEGGDLVSLNGTVSAVITGNTLVITWAAGSLMPTTSYYIRIKGGLIEDAGKLAYAGINNNTGWNFTTASADKITPAITAGPVLATVHASGHVWTNDNFFIDFADVLYLSKGVAVTASKLPTSGITLVDDGGNEIPFTLTYSTADQAFKLDPYGSAANSANLTGQSFTVTIAEGTVRTIDNKINKAVTKTFNRGDWTAPTFDMFTNNYSGTTFDIIIENASEVQKISYIVVAKDQAHFMAPGLEQILGYDKDGNTTKTGSGKTDDRKYRTVSTDASLKDYEPLVAGNPVYAYENGTAGSFYGVEIFAQGVINVPTTVNPYDALERVINLPATNGKDDYVVYAVGYDDSDEGVFNPDFTGQLLFAANTNNDGNIGDIVSADALTVDILMPTVWFDADSAGYNAVMLNKDMEDGNATTGLGDPAPGYMARKAQIKLNFNEGIRLANGTAIGDNDIPSFIHVTDITGTPVEIGFAATISADKKQIIIVADSAYKSAATIEVSIDPTEIEDLAGNELQPTNTDLMNQEFLVETYQPVLALFDPADQDTKVDANCITVRFNRVVYVPRDDEPTQGDMQLLNNDPASPYWAGKYFEIREGDGTSAGNTDPSVKAEFQFVVSYTDTETSVSICRSTGTWSSETWYWVWAEGQLLDENRYELADGFNLAHPATGDFKDVTTNVTGAWSIANNPAPNNIAAATGGDNQTASFKYEDTRAPEVVFYQASFSNAAATPDPVLDNIDGATDVLTSETIGVYVDEYVNLGFADHIDFNAPGGGLVVDNNAMRRYFRIIHGTDTLSFDVRNVNVILASDRLFLELDPYYIDANGKITDNPNFTAGETYTVQYISTDREGNVGGAYEDDNDNLVVRDEATFTVASTAPTATVNVTYTPMGTSVSSATSTIVFTFDQYYTGTVAPQILFGVDGSEVPNTSGVVAGDYHSITYTINPPLVDTETYRVVATQGSFAFNNGTTWPPASSTNPYAADSSWTFTTVDGTPPVVFPDGVTPTLALTPNDDATGVPLTTDLVIRFDEDVLPVSGKYLYLWESGVSEIFRIPAPSCDHVGGDSIVVDNALFAGNLKYNTAYHVIIEPGFVTDLSGNAFAGINTLTYWNFVTGSQPGVTFSAFTPKDATLAVSTPLKITLSRAAAPQVGATVSVYDITGGSNTLAWTGNAIGGLTSTDNINWTIAGFTPVATHMYSVEISANAFIDGSGNPTVGMTHATTSVATNPATPVWVINYNDIAAPKARFWPVADEKHIPYNAYLYIQFDEPIALSNGTAVITDPNVIAQNIPSFITLERSSVSVPIKVEFVDNDKRTLRVTPLDPTGHNYAGDNNPTMATETGYTLTVDGGPVSGLTIVDASNNAFVGDNTDFTTEDITAPTISAVSAGTITSNSAKVTFTTSEKGHAYVYVVSGAPSSAPSAATVIASAQWDKADVTGTVTSGAIALGDTEGSAKYTAYVVVVDVETDVYADPDPTLWMFTDTNDQPWRIKDILPAPNTSLVATTGAFWTCDDDAPYVIATSPVHLATEVALNAKIYLTFNENVAYADVVDGYIKLRKAKNNAQVPASVSTVAGVTGPDSIMIVPSTLEQSTDYYVEIDRYAVTDESTCSTNRAPEWVGKDHLYFSTIDATAPVIDSTDTWSPIVMSKNTCVDPAIDELTLYVTEKNDIAKNGADSRSIRIYRGTNSSTGVLLEVIPVADARVTTDVVDNKKVMKVDVSGFIFLGDDQYYVEVDAGSIVDEAGNGNVLWGWTFSTLDNVAPNASWEIHSLNYYFNNSASTEVGIHSYWTKEDSGDAGETAANASSNSALKITFDEDVQVQTSASGNGTWLPLTAYDASKTASYTGSTTDGFLSRSEIFKFVHVSGLTYNDDITKTGLLIKEVTSNSILIAFKADTSALYGAANANFDGGSLAYLYDGSLSMDAVTYDVTLDKAEIKDMPSCSNTPNMLAESDLVSIQTRDDNPPMLDISACAANACISATGEIVLTFDKPVVKSSYDIVWLDHENKTADNLLLTAANLQDTGDGRYLELTRVSTGDSVKIKDITVVDKNTIMITPNTALASDEDYKIVFNKWTVKEWIENDPSGTLFEGDSCTFHVFDYMPPVLKAGADSLSPADNSINVDAAKSQIVMKFNKKVMAGTGIARIRRENGQIFEEFNATDAAHVVISSDKKTVTLKFSEHTAFEDFTMYYVEMPEGFLTDTVVCANYNKFAGFSAQLDPVTGELVSAGWNWKTSDGTPPELLSDVEGNLTGLFPVPGDVNVPKNSTLTMIFDENVNVAANPNAGIVIYYNNGDSPIPAPGQAGDFGNAVEFIPWGSPRIMVSGSDIYNGFTSNVVTVTPATVFDKLGTYYARVTGDEVTDVAGNMWSSSTNTLLNEVKDYEWYWTITNDVAPILVETDPTYDGVTAPNTYVQLPAMDEGYVVADLSMTFEDGNGNPLDVIKGDDARMVRIYEYVYNPVTLAWNDRLWKEMPITDESITISGNVVTLNDVVLRDGINGDSVYYVTVDPGAILNGYPGSNTFWAGIANGFRWRFQTASDDVFVDGYDILSPNIVEDGDSARDLTIEAASTLQVAFNEGIEALAAPTGMVKVYDADADSLVEAVTVTQSMCSGATLTVPLTKLYDETNFYVVVEAGAFGDTSTVSTPNFEFGGLDVWAFHTGDNTAPVPTVVMPADGDDCVASDVTLTLTFDETYGVVANDGSITVTDSADFEVVIPASELMVDGNTVSAEVMGLPDTSMIYVTVATGAVLDGDAHSPLANPEYSWSFMTGENTAPTVVAMTPAMAVTADTVLSITFSEPVNVDDLMGKVTVNGDTVVMTSTDSITYTAAIDSLPSESTVEVIIAEGAFMDVNAGCTPNGIAADTLTFTVADIAAPTAMYYPATADDYTDLELSIVFDDAVAAATGDVMIYDADEDTLVATIPAADFVTTDDTTFTYVTNDLYYGSFYVMIDAGSFVDATAADVAKEYAGIDDNATWTIDIVDNVFDNCVTIISPLDGTTGVETTTDLVLEFCTERIVPGSASKFVTVAKQSNVSQDAAVETAVEDSMISVVDGKYRLTIHAADLEEMTTYSVIIAPGAITDEAGNAFEGIIDANAWNFTTLDATAPVVTLVADSVTNVDGTASMTRDEAGAIYLVHESVPSEMAAITAAIGDMKAVAGLVTTAGVNVTVSTVGLVPGVYRAVAIDAAGNVGESDDVVVVEEEVIVEVPEYTIAEIQGSADASPYVDETVATTGVVTTIDNNGYYLQDANAAWSGIYVYDPDNAATLNVGTSIKVTGTISEYHGVTEFGGTVTIEPVLFNLNVVPVEVSASDAISEMYESVRVKIVGTSAVASTGSDDVTLSSASGTDYTVSLYIYKPGEYTWDIDYKYTVMGVVYERDGVYKVEPYFDGDIVNQSLIDNKFELVDAIQVYPNPFNDQINIKSPNGLVIDKAIITNVAGQVVKEVSNPGRSIATSDLLEGVYFISLHTEEGIASERIIKR